MTTDLPLVKVVGVSASGKSTLVRNLREAGYDARSVSQEHTEVQDLWRRIRPPVVLIYLDVNLAMQQERRPDVTWNQANVEVEQQRLAHARAAAHVTIDTSAIAATDTLALALDFLRRAQIAHASTPLPPATPTGGISHEYKER